MVPGLNIVKIVMHTGYHLFRQKRLKSIFEPRRRGKLRGLQREKQNPVKTTKRLKYKDILNKSQKTVRKSNKNEK